MVRTSDSTATLTRTICPAASQQRVALAPARLAYSPGVPAGWTSHSPSLDAKPPESLPALAQGPAHDLGLNPRLFRQPTDQDRSPVDERRILGPWGPGGSCAK